MIRIIAFAAFALAVATSAQAMSPVPLHQPDGMITQVREACGPVRVRNQWCLRGQNHQAPCPPRDAQVCAMEWRRLRSILLRPNHNHDKNSLMGPPGRPDGPLNVSPARRSH